jgi:hypothetical protein
MDATVIAFITQCVLRPAAIADIFVGPRYLDNSHYALLTRDVD